MKFLIAIFLLSGFFFLVSGFVFPDVVFGSDTPGHSGFLNIWEGTGSEGGPTCNVQGPCTFCDAIKVTANIVKLLFQVAIPIAVAMIVYGALRLMLAGGSEEQITKSRKVMTSAVIGLVIALSAWIIVNTLLHVLTGNPSFPWNNITC